MIPRMMSAAALVATVTALVTATACERRNECWDGLAVGLLVDVALIDRYGPDSPYLGWVDVSSGRPSCRAHDGLDVGTTVRLAIESRIDGDCAQYLGRPLSGVTGIDFSGELRPIGVLSCQVNSGGYWRFAALRDRTHLDSSPFGERVVAGAYPPLRVIRWHALPTGECFDEWVGELRAVSPSEPDAGG